MSCSRLSRVLITADPPLPVPPKLYGGIERIVASLVAGLLARGHEVGLLAHRHSTAEVTAKFSWPTTGTSFSHVRTLQHAVRTFAPDILHSFSRLAFLFPVLANRQMPKIMSFQREPTPRTVRWANRLARGSLTFTGCSDYISRKGRCIGGKWETIHNFVDLERYTFQAEVAFDAPLVFLSRIEPIKGAHLAIAACRRARRRLIIAGNHSDKDDHEGRYWREVIKPQIDGREIEYVGPVNDIQKNELLGRAAALIVPIQWEEPFGIVFAEALACGTPVISCPRGALPEIVEDEQQGFLVSSDKELSGAVNKLGQVGRPACHRKAETHFSAEAIVPVYEALYRSISR